MGDILTALGEARAELERLGAARDPGPAPPPPAPRSRAPDDFREWLKANRVSPAPGRTPASGSVWVRTRITPKSVEARLRGRGPAVRGAVPIGGGRFRARPRPADLLRQVSGPAPELDAQARVAVLDAAEALGTGDAELLRRFVQYCLRQRALPWGEDRAAVFEALLRAIRTRRWPELPLGSVFPYLGAVVYREAWRLVRDREQADRLDRVRNLPLLPTFVLPSLPESPFDEAVRREAQALQARALDAIAPKLPAAQRAILDFLVQGHSPAEAVAAARASWVSYQALQRKAQRRLRRLPA